MIDFEEMMWMGGENVENMKIAAVYIRVSTEDQVEYSPDAQLVELKKYAKIHGYLIPEEYVFIDQGISGKNTARRESFNEMIGVAKGKPKPFDVVLVWKFSRFARNREDSVVYKSMLRKQLGIQVISISEPVGEDKMSVIIEAMIEAMDEYYSINLAEEVRRGMSEKARRGELQAVASFGYKVEENQLIPIEKEAIFVREMFTRYLNGEGFFGIAKWLNGMGVRTHRGGKFENRTVEYILRNPVYVGRLRWNPVGKTGRDFENENILVVQSTHSPLVDVEIWDRVQERMKIQKKVRKKGGKPDVFKKDWLSGVVRCSGCGGTLVFTKPHYFKCNQYGKGACETSQHIHRDLLHEAILEQLSVDCTSDFGVECRVIEGKSSGIDEIGLLEKALGQVNRKKERLREAYLSGSETVEEYVEMRSVLDGEEARLSGELEGVRAKGGEKSEGGIEDILEEMRGKCSDNGKNRKNMGSFLSGRTMEEKISVMGEILEECIFDKGTMELKMVYRVEL